MQKQVRKKKKMETPQAIQPIGSQIWSAVPVGSHWVGTSKRLSNLEMALATENIAGSSNGTRRGAQWPELGLVQESGMRSGELNWELTSASSRKDLAPAEGSHHAAATGVVWKIMPENQPVPGQSQAKEEETNLSTRESRGTSG